MGKPNKHGVDENGCIIESGFFWELGSDFEPEPEEDWEDEEDINDELKAKERFADSGDGVSIAFPKKD